jgi:hypothetical protein
MGWPPCRRTNDPVAPDALRPTLAHMTSDRERIGLSDSTPEGRELSLAAGLSGQTGWRRKVAYTFAVLWLAAMVVGVVVAAVAVLR